MSPHPLLAAALLLALIPAALPAQAVVRGRVALPAAREETVVDRRYEVVTRGDLVATNPPLAVVYLEGDFPPPADAPVASLPQKDLRFLAALLPVRTGTRVEFPNLDDTYHNIFSYSAPKRFDLGRYRRDEQPVPFQLFDRPGLVTLRCDIHEHMRALVLVLDTPHFVVTAPDGSFTLPNLPPGRHVLKAWINSQETRALTVELTADSALAVEFP